MNFNWTDNVVTRALSKICDMVCLNVLWLICSIPIFTIGASTAALYTVMLKLVKNEEGYIFRGFFKAFKENFKQSTIMWLIILALAIVWWVDFNFAGSLGGNAGFVLTVIFILLGILLLSVMIYVFPLTARYENTIRSTFRNALILTIAKLPYTLLMILILVAAVVLSFWTVQTLMMAIPLWMLIGVSLLAWIYSWLLRRVFTIFEAAGEESDKQ
ncbi:hypothetical protein B5F07_05895 [Lachnoclostridium sp. An169]|uniref:YesL family protein n=1 Tax=Lachnoclostridium sp. An169 TaxID=1965569 RepID=UPI000B381643|nr:DUF624 domain-containing protein [Lachnoclostridium sp. An169]OUP85202.1 hypothetical protein B5F07_05895 [Lachnoclostridium sp. An169]HJA67469.1 DUF624 domain-containing protein [Candidatus Mediterraneibacter cottocaccae]